MDEGTDGQYTLGDYAAENGAATQSRSQSRDDPLTVLDEEDPIFADEDMLRIDHVPEPDKIVGRDQQIETVARRMKPAIEGGSGKGTLLLGKSGSGKTLVTKYVTREVIQRGEQNDVNIGRAIINCSQRRSETQTVLTLARVLNKPEKTGTSIPSSGIATGEYYDRLWSIINELYDSIIIVLDEIDQLAPHQAEGLDIEPEEADDSRLLMQLSRAGEEDDIQAGLTVFGISNDLKYGDRLDTRVASSFSPDELVFPAYDANQLGDILERRRDAFHEGVLTDDIIPLSAFSAQEHGDARRAIDLFRLAGEVARQQDADQVREEHVRTANSDAEVTRIRDLIQGTPTQAKVAIAALAAMDEFTETDYFKATEMYRVYRLFANQLNVGVLGQKRITDQLREYDTLKILDMNRTSEGYREGTYLQITLLDDRGLILQSIGLDGRMENLPLGDEMRQRIRKAIDS